MKLQKHSKKQAFLDYDYSIVWGTNVSVREAMRKFRRFLNEFRTDGQLRGSSISSIDNNNLDGVDDMDMDDGTPQGDAAANALQQPYYMRLLSEIRKTQTYNININCKNLYDFAPTRSLYQQLVRYPQEIVQLL